MEKKIKQLTPNHIFQKYIRHLVYATLKSSVQLVT